MNSWRRITLGESFSLQRGFDITKAEQTDGPFPVVTSSGITSHHSEWKVKGPGVVVGRKGSLGTVFFTAGDFWPHDTTLWVKDFHGNDRRFAYYFFKTMGLEKYDCGASNPTLNRNHIHGIEVSLPPLPIQRRIATILAAYDDLIESNFRRIRILEEMAQALYREWFVEFRFPGHGRVRLVESPLGKIPEGWKFKPLGDHLVGLESGRRPKGGVRDIVDGIPSIGAENIDGIGRHDFAAEKFVPLEFFAEMKTGVVRDRDVAIYKDGAYIGKSSLFRDAFPHSECCVNEHVFLLRTNERTLTQNLLYLWLRQPDTVSAIHATNANAAQPGINQQSVRNLSILTPHQVLVKEFDRLVEPLLGQIVSLAKKDEVLRRTRDLLLPRLISGELDVSDLDIAIPETVA